jgi:alkylated DNA repair dioxygenase AlkB
MARLQTELFDELPAPVPAGCVLVREFLTLAEEHELVALLRGLPLEAAQYKGYVARRRVASFGGRFDYDTHVMRPSPPMPASLAPLRDKVARWLGVEPQRFAHVLVSEYAPGTPLGWHRDVPAFESIVGVCLLGAARMKLRPYPPLRPKAADVVNLMLPPRAAYGLTGPARWDWQHCIAPTEALRYSVTFRTRRGDALPLPGAGSIAPAEAVLSDTRTRASP